MEHLKPPSSRVGNSLVATLFAFSLVFATACASQEASSSGAAIQSSQDSPVPNLVRHKGVLASHAGKQLILSFSIYVDQLDRSPIWQENQLVQLDSKGEFTVLLGAGSAIGLPESLFATGQPRWLGIAVKGGSSEEQRSLLTSVPYAMKAADSESLGGQPADSYVTQEQLASRFAAMPASAGSAGKKAYPFTAGITGITAGTGLTGGGTSGTVMLAIDPKKVPLLSTPNVFTKGATFDAATAITGASAEWMLTVTNTSKTAKGSFLAQAEGGNLGLEGLSPAGFAVEGVTTTGTGIVGKAVNGFGGSFTNNSVKWPAISASNLSGPGVLVTAGAGAAGSFENSSVSNPALGATNGAATVGNSYGIGVQGKAGGVGAIGINGIAANGLGGLFSNNNATYAALAGENSSTGYTAVGVYGSSANGQGVRGSSTDGSAVYGTSTTGNGVDGKSTSGNGVNGVSYSGSGYGVNGFAANNFGVSGQSTYSDGVYGATIYGNGVYGQSSNKDGVVGVTGDSAHSGVYGQYSGGNTSGFFASAGVWGDGSGSTAGVAGSADDGWAGFFQNNSSNGAGTIFAENSAGGGSHTLFHTIMATSPLGTCGFGGNGDLSCTGQVKALVSTSDARVVETYSVQSPENWLEDFGSGKLENGRAVIHLDPTFASAVNTGLEYHVFLTPQGDAQPLFVTGKTAAGFEVRESAKGTQSIRFDYRIVARRRGLEAQRMVEVTAKLKAEVEAAHTRLRNPRRSGSAIALPTTATAVSQGFCTK